MADRYGWLQEEHGVYKSHKERWKRNERRLRGGEAVLDELRPYEWEYAHHDEEDTDAILSAMKRGNLTEHYSRRQAEATYINFPDMYATAMTGFLMRKVPEAGSGLTFGALGNVERTGRRPSAAEMVFYNVDGAGVDGSQWDTWWMAVQRRAMATGHRWLFCDAPLEGAENEQDWLDGRRPYLTEFSPLSVPMWYFEDGHLAFAVVKEFRPAPLVKNGQLTGMDPQKQHYMLMVREGVEVLGDEFAGGGWWLFDPDTKKVEVNGEEVKGDWESTGGEIPLWAHYYDRDKGGPSFPAFSRSGLTELGQLAVSYMNLSSAWDFDIWDAAGSVQLLLGVTQTAFNIATGMLSRGNKMAPVPKDDDSGTVPDVYDASQGAVSSQVFTARLEMKHAEASRLAAMESIGTPDASGESKKAGFADLKSPRLALMASEIEQSQNTAIHFLEQRFTGTDTPSGEVKWDREFELMSMVEEVREIFELEALSRVRSQTVAVEGMLKALRDRNFIPNDETLETIRGEYRRAAADRSTREATERTLEEAFTGA